MKGIEMKKHILILLLLMSSKAFGLFVQNGQTNVITYFTMRDRTTNVRDTTITIANLEMYYIEEQAAISADVFSGAHSAVTDAHADGECIHIGQGEYRVDWPDAAFDGGIGKKVELILVDGDAGAFTETIEVELSPPVDIDAVGGNTVPCTKAQLVSDGLTAAAVNAEADTALSDINLDKLLAVSTGIAADADLGAVVVDGSVMSHVMSPTAGTSDDYDASTDSLGASSTSAATLLNTDVSSYTTVNTWGWLLNLIKDLQF